ncbi:hypothetical protein ACOMHN_028750 [Nucella lapillus]
MLTRRASVAEMFIGRPMTSEAGETGMMLWSPVRFEAHLDRPGLQAACTGPGGGTGRSTRAPPSSPRNPSTAQGAGSCVGARYRGGQKLSKERYLGTPTIGTAHFVSQAHHRNSPLCKSGPPSEQPTL